MKNYLLFFLVSFSILNLDAQKEMSLVDQNEIFSNVNLGLMGAVTGVSLNYELLKPLGPKSILSARLGVGITEEFNLCSSGNCPYVFSMTMPHSLSILIGESKSKIEIGLGGILLNGTYLYYPSAAYRFFPDNRKKVNLRLGVSYPILGKNQFDFFLTYFEFNIGKTF